MASRDFALVRPPRLASRSCVSRAGKRGGARGREGEPERRSLLFSAAGVGVGGDDDLFSPGREKKTSPTKNKAGRRRDLFVPGQDPRSRRGLVFFLCFRLLSFKGRERKAKGGGGTRMPPKKKIQKIQKQPNKGRRAHGVRHLQLHGGSASRQHLLEALRHEGALPRGGRAGQRRGRRRAVESSEGPGAGAVSLGEEEEGEEDGAWIKRWWWLRVWGRGRGGSETSRRRRDELKKKRRKGNDWNEKKQKNSGGGE